MADAIEIEGFRHDIVKTEVRITDRTATEVVNRHWVATFPDENHRSARHTEVQKLDAGLLAHAQFLAYVE